MSKLTHAKTKKRDLMIISLLASNPSITHDQANKASKEKYGCGIGFDRFKMLKTEAMKGPPAGAESLPKGEDKVKKAMKKGTTPLKAKVKELGEIMAENGIEEALMQVVDGKPQWHIVEVKRTRYNY